jgi:hypothetical protein
MKSVTSEGLWFCNNSRHLSFRNYAREAGGFVAQVPSLFPYYFSKLSLPFNRVKSAAMRSRRLSIFISVLTCILREAIDFPSLVSVLPSDVDMGSVMWQARNVRVNRR